MKKKKIRIKSKVNNTKKRTGSVVLSSRKRKILAIIIMLVIIALLLTLTLNKKQIISNSAETSNKKEHQKLAGAYTDVVSLDGITVPVPTGYTASSVPEEQYVNGLNIEKKASLENLTLSSDSTQSYPWTYDTAISAWKSGNYQIDSSTSTLETNTFTIGSSGGRIEVEWSVCSQNGVDILYVNLIDTVNNRAERCPSISNNIYGTAESSLTYVPFRKELTAGTYKLEIIYTKNASTNTGLDRGYVKTAKAYNYDDEGDETVNSHQYGGFVIYEGTEPVPTTATDLLNAQKTRNQWVWVPVPDTSRIYEETNGVKKSKLWTFNLSNISQYSNSNYEPNALSSYDREYYFERYGMQGYTKDKFDEELKREYEDAIESIEAYGGFYIGRYETGEIGKGKPKVVKLNTDIGSQTWYAMYGRMKYLAGNKNVKTNMIWGNLFDETLQWLIDSGDKEMWEMKASTGWGNYYDSTFTYTNVAGTNTKKSVGINTKVPTGSTEYTKANNIYDLAGNVYDWTLEGDGTIYRRLRRGLLYRLRWCLSGRLPWQRQSWLRLRPRSASVRTFIYVALTSDSDALKSYA